MGAVSKKITKAQLINEIAETASLTKVDVKAVLDALLDVIKRELGSRGPGEFTLPNIAKFKVRKLPARKERKGVDPFTGEERMFKPKPASKRIRVAALKKLKDLVK
jgi:nucleoid DNA-binding protein